MHNSEGAAAQRLISRLIVVLLVQTGALDRDDAIEGFREAGAQIAKSVADMRLRRQLLDEIESLVRTLETCGPRPIH